MIRVIAISLFATFACVGIIKAATTIGNNISTGGTITGSGTNTLYGATSIGGALTATSTLTVNGATTLYGLLTGYGDATLSNLTATGTLSVTGLTTLGNASTTLLSTTGTLGPNLITNGTFTTDCTGWTSTNWTCGGTVADHNTVPSNTNGLTQTGLSLTAGDSYKLTYTVSGRTAGAVSTGHGASRTADDTYIEYFTDDINTTSISFAPTTGFDGAIDDVSLQKVTSGGLTVDGATTLRGAVTIDGSLYSGEEGLSLLTRRTADGATTGQTTILNGFEHYSYLSGSGSYDKYHGIKNNITFSNASGTYTFTGVAGDEGNGIKGYSQIINLTQGGTKALNNLFQYGTSNTVTTNATISATGIWASYMASPFVTSTGAPTWNVNEMASFYATGAQSVGNNNYGVLLRGDGIGAGITFGANKEDSIYHQTGANLLASSTNGIDFSVGGNVKALITSAGVVANTATGPALLDEDPTGTNPSIVPDRTDDNTGIGQNGTDTLSLIAGGTEVMRIQNINGKFINFAGISTSGIIASTTQTQGEGPLTSSYNYVTTVANTSDTVTMPAIVPGRVVFIFNAGANTLQVFPASGHNFYGLAADAPITIASGSSVWYIGQNALQWVPLK